MSVSHEFTERVFPSTPLSSERVVSLSLLDATTAKFALTNAIWLFERPSTINLTFSELAKHLQQTLGAALDVYPQWCGQCKAITTLDGTPPGVEARSLPPHARRYGRIYAHFGTASDPGVDFTVATSNATLDALHPVTRTLTSPLWTPDLKCFSPVTEIASSLTSNTPDPTGLRKPLLAIQVTLLADNGFVLAAKAAHPMADITSLIHLIKTWAAISRTVFLPNPLSAPEPRLELPIFDPPLLDALAAGDINAPLPEPSIFSLAHSLPFHRYDWWTPVHGSPWPLGPPPEFGGLDVPSAAASQAMPWSEWNISAPVKSAIVHLTKDQVEQLWSEAVAVAAEEVRPSKHDAVLAHIWACIVRARQLDADDELVHCDLTMGVRPALGLAEGFMGSPIVMMNIEGTGKEIGSLHDRGKVVARIRGTIAKVSNRERLAAHLHALAFEKSPQRIWQAFLGTRHILVTTWARAGIYEVDFGVGAGIRYADGLVPEMDGCVLIKEGPSMTRGEMEDARKPSWTDNGVDISLHLRTEDMDRLWGDPLLLPRLGCHTTDG